LLVRKEVFASSKITLLIRDGGVPNLSIPGSGPLTEAEKAESHRRKRQQQKREAIESLLEVMSWITSEKREPDEWEQTFLVRALASISSGCYVLGKTQAGLAKASAEQRSLKPDPRAKLARKYSLAQIGVRVQEVATAPLLQSQTFDFIEQSESSDSEAAGPPDARSAGVGN
jgi:hypothetical protein